MMFYLTFLSLRKNGFDGFSMFFSSLPGVLKVEIYLELGGKKECPGETMGIRELDKTRLDNKQEMSMPTCAACK